MTESLSKKLIELVVVTSDLSSTGRVGKVGEESHLGVFYSSFDRLHHVAPYIPWGMPPGMALCGLRREYWSATRDLDHITKKPCLKCFAHTLESATASEPVQLFLRHHEGIGKPLGISELIRMIPLS